MNTVLFGRRRRGAADRSRPNASLRSPTRTEADKRRIVERRGPTSMTIGGRVRSGKKVCSRSGQSRARVRPVVDGHAELAETCATTPRAPTPNRDCSPNRRTQTDRLAVTRVTSTSHSTAMLRGLDESVAARSPSSKDACARCSTPAAGQSRAEIRPSRVTSSSLTGRVVACRRVRPTLPDELRPPVSDPGLRSSRRAVRTALRSRPSVPRSSRLIRRRERRRLRDRGDRADGLGVLQVGLDRSNNDTRLDRDEVDADQGDANPCVDHDSLCRDRESRTSINSFPRM